MGPLLVAGLLGATVLYLYDLYITGPAAARVFIAHLPALAWYGYITGWQSWRLLESYAAVPVALFAVALLQYLLVARDALLVRATMGRR